MEKREALLKLDKLIGRELHQLAKELDIPIYGPSGKVNKGWAGHTIERYLGLPLNSSKSPNFGSWELKVVPIRWSPRKKQWVFKETMAITMIDPYNLIRTPFEKSYLYQKLQRMVVAVRSVGNKNEDSSYLVGIFEISLENEKIFQQVKEDYEKIRRVVAEKIEEGYSYQESVTFLSGRMGIYIQPRTKGKGYGSITRAFYCRKTFLELFLDLSKVGIQ